MRMRMTACAMSLLVMGCATTQPSLGTKSLQLRRGMSKQEVSTLLGTPQTTAVDEHRETWQYWQLRSQGGLLGGITLVPADPMFAPAQDRLSVVFKEDKLESWGDQLSFTGMMKATSETMGEYMKNMPPMRIEQTIKQESSKPDGER